MASYRYLRDIKPEDLVPEKEAPLTGRAKAANWWHYHWKFVAAGAAVAALALYFCYDVFWHRAPDPDYQIALVGATLTDGQTEALEQRLSALATDVNGDGSVIVQINAYDVDYSQAGRTAEDLDPDSDAASSTAASAAASDTTGSYVDPYTQMAADVRLTADFQDAQSGIFLVCDPAGFERSTAALRYLDGTPSEADEDGFGPDDWYNMVYRVSDCPVLATALAADGTAAEAEEDIGDILTEKFYIGFRSTYEEKDIASLADDDVFFAQLTAGAVSTAAEDAAA